MYPPSALDLRAYTSFLGADTALFEKFLCTHDIRHNAWSVEMRPQTDECITLRSVMKGVQSAQTCGQRWDPAFRRHLADTCRAHSVSVPGMYVSGAQPSDAGS